MDAKKADFELVNLLMLTENANECFGAWLTSENPEFLATVKLYIKRIEQQLNAVKTEMEITQ